MTEGKSVEELRTRELEELEQVGILELVRDRRTDGRFSEGSIDDLLAALGRTS